MTTTVLPRAHTEVLTGHGALDRHAEAVDALLAAVAAPLTARRTWWRAWATAFPEARPWVVARWGADGSLAALAPLARRRRRGVTELVALGDGVSDYARLPARSQGDAVALAASIAAHLQRLRTPWIVSLRQLPEHDPVATSLAAQLRHARLVSGWAAPQTAVTAREIAPYVSRNHRQTVRNRLNRLRRAGHEPRLELLTDPEAVAGALDEVVSICRAREREKLGHSPLDDPRRERFLRSSALDLARQGALELAVLRADGAIAAYSLNLVEDTVYRSWNTHHAPSWAEFSPGKVLHYLIAERVVTDERFETLDWMMGMESHKWSLATHAVPATDLLAWSSPPAAAVLSRRLVRHQLEVWGERDERAVRALEALRAVRERVRAVRS